MNQEVYFEELERVVLMLQRMDMDHGWRFMIPEVAERKRRDHFASVNFALIRNKDTSSILMFSLRVGDPDSFLYKVESDKPDILAFRPHILGIKMAAVQNLLPLGPTSIVSMESTEGWDVKKYWLQWDVASEHDNVRICLSTRLADELMSPAFQEHRIMKYVMYLVKRLEKYSLHLNMEAQLRLAQCLALHLQEQQSTIDDFKLFRLNERGNIVLAIRARDNGGLLLNIDAPQDSQEYRLLAGELMDKFSLQYSPELFHNMKII